MADRGGRGRGGGGGRGDFRGRGRGDGGGGRGRGRGDGGGFHRGGGGGGYGGASERGGGFRGGGFRGGRGGSQPAKVFGDEKGVPEPDTEVTKIEDAGVKDLSTALARVSIDSNQLPQRPGYGTAGRPIILWTNYLELKGVESETVIYRYSIAFQGQEEIPKPKKRRVIELLRKEHPFSEVPTASDGVQMLVCTKKVKLPDSRSKYDIEWYPADGKPLPAADPEEAPRVTSSRRRNTYSVLVEALGTVSLKQLINDLSSSTNVYPLKLETIQALNILLAHGPSSDPQIAVASQNRFYPFGSHPQIQAISLGSGLQALRGYFSSVRTSVNRVLVNINVATGAFYKPGSLLDVMREFSGGPPANEGAYRKLAAFVRKLRIETNYIPARDKTTKKIQPGQTKRKVHVIFDLSPFKTNASNTFFMWNAKDGTTKRITVEQYFAQEYKIKLQTPQAPLVNYGNAENKKWIPGELCSILPGQLARRLLQGDQTREMIAFAARRPFENAESITRDGVQVTKLLPINQGLNTHLEPFGIKVNTNLLTVQGRILQVPKVQYRGRDVEPSNGAWNLDIRKLGKQPLRISKPLGPWSALIINSGNRDTIPGGFDAARSHLQQFKDTLEMYGMGPAPLQQTGVANINFWDVQDKNVVAVRNLILQALKSAFKQPPKFLFILLPNDNAVLYDCIKQVCDIEYGIPNICSIGSKFSKEKGQAQYFANVALKFNQKLGGVNHSVAPEKMKPLDEKTIVFGIDVTHPSPGSSEDSPSIAGVVASVDKHFSQYPASIRTQKGREEMVIELEEMIIERLRLWQKRNGGGLPNKVIVYRDGVSEGQYSIILGRELPSFVKAFDKLYGAAAKHPKISIIVVGKRHHTRFYPTKMDDTDGKTGNPQPGTVVDRGVTGEKLFDFFLLAHQGLQGTSKPAHYVVIKDDNKLGADQLQALTHHLCYTFARATRAVSICPPAYYADILCDRGRSYLHGVLKGEGSAFTAADWHRDVHARLAETMFYL